MKSIDRAGSLLAVVVLSLIAWPVVAGGTDSGKPIQASELQQDGYTFPSDLVAKADPTQLANYAWRLFIAANNLTDATLQDGSKREQPSKSFIASGSKPLLGNPVVFESFYHRTEAYPFYKGDPAPSPVGKTPVYRFAPATDGGEGFTVSNGQYVNLDETNQIGQNFLYYKLSNAPNFPVLYMAKVNSVAANYAHGRFKPSKDKSWNFPSGVMEVKAAWRRVQDIKHSDPSRYHQATATYYVGEEGQVPEVRTDTFALIALHIIQKTDNYPQFIFTTFEHVDAVTRDDSGNIIDPAFVWTSQNLAYGEGEPTNPTATPYGAYTKNEPGLSGASNAVATYNLPPAGKLPQDAVVVVQPKTIISQVNDVNNQVHQLITSLDENSVWANYRLKGVQAIPSSNQEDPNFYLANIVVESSQPGIQLFRGNIGGTGKATFTNTRSTNNLTTKPLVEGQPVPPTTNNMGGCQGCHGVAQYSLGGDFSFLVSAAAGTGEKVDAVPPSDLPAAAVQAHQERVIQNRAGKVD